MREKDKMTLREAERIKLRKYVTEELDDMVDYRTGEILKDRNYTTHPIERDRKKEVVQSFGEIFSCHQMECFMDKKDRRRLSLFNACRAVYDMDKGRAYFESAPVLMSTSTMDKLNRLISRLDYRNVILARPKEISKTLGVDHRNLYRHLSTLKGLLDWSGPGQGIKQGSLKVEVCPAYGFRYESDLLAKARLEAVIEWYRTRCRSLADDGAFAMEALLSRQMAGIKEDLAS